MAKYLQLLWDNDYLENALIIESMNFLSEIAEDEPVALPVGDHSRPNGRKQGKSIALKKRKWQEEIKDSISDLSEEESKKRKLMEMFIEEGKKKRELMDMVIEEGKKKKELMDMVIEEGKQKMSLDQIALDDRVMGMDLATITDPIRLAYFKKRQDDVILRFNKENEYNIL